MMLAGPALRVVPLTVHIPLAEVPERLTGELIVAKARIVARGPRREFAVAAPRLAIPGPNPHAGESGRLGDEEIRIVARSEEPTSALQSLIRISCAVFCLQKKNKANRNHRRTAHNGP